MGSEEQAAQAFLRERIPLYEHIGLTIESARDGVYRCRVPLDERTKNHFDTVHAALQWAAAEMLGGLIVATHFRGSRLFGAVRAVSIEFLRPARTAIVAEARFPDSRVAQAKRDLEGEGEARFEVLAVVRDESGREVSRTRGEYVLRPLREPSS